MSEFDLGAMLESLAVPNLGTNREQIVYLELDLLDEDEENFYATEGIEDLAANIAAIGLLDPLRVRPNPEAPGRFKVVSGHRRRKALTLLKGDDPEKWGSVPCIQEDNAQSPAAQELRLILANRDNRKISSSDLAEQAKRVEKLLYQLQEEQGVEFPGRMRDHVAKAVGINKTRLSNLKVIEEKLIPHWKALFQKGKLPESTALAMAHLAPEWQDVMFNHWGERLHSLCQGHPVNVKKVVEKVSQVDCRAHKGSKCLIPQERKKHIAALGQYDSYSCSGCCLDCSSLATCKDSCYLAGMKKESLIQKRKDEKAEQKAAEKERIAPTLDYIRGVYARWLEALQAKGLTAAEYLKACGRTYWLEDAAKEFEKYAAHPEKVKAENTKLPFNRNLWPDDAKSLVAAADVLGCSIDWLLGREVSGPGAVPNLGTTQEAAQNVPNLGTIQEPEETVPCSGWRTGDPEEPGSYAVLTRPYPGSRRFYADDRKWDGCAWEAVSYDDEAVVYWMPMPEE